MFRNNQSKTDRKGGIRSWLPVWLAITLGTPVFIGLFSGAPKPRPISVVPVPSPRTWDKVSLQLDQLDQASAEAAERHLQRVATFFNEKKRGAKAFSEWAYGWTAKYHAVVGKLQGDDGVRFREFLREKFQLTMFKPDDLKSVLESAMAGALTEISGLENSTLVQIRADLAEDQLFRGNPREFQSDDAFTAEYQRVTEEVLPRVLTDLNVVAASQLANLVGSEVVAQTLGRSLAARIGLNSGLMGSAARSGVVTFGVSVVAFFAIDYLLDWVLQLFGYNPAGDLRVQVEAAMDRTQARVIDGDPVAVAEYQRLRQQERDEALPELRQQYRVQADALEESGDLGLRFALGKLLELQGAVRREALRKLVTAHGGQ